MSTADWFEAIGSKAEKFVQDPADRELLTPETYDMIRDPHYPRMESQGIFGEYVEVEAFQALADRFLKAWELVKVMEGNANSPESPDSCACKYTPCRFAWLCDKYEPATPEPDGSGPSIEEMVNRFLGWRLPEDFYPDCGISYKKLSPTSHPIGTNLFSATQAKAMIEYIMRPPKPDERGPEVGDLVISASSQTRQWNGLPDPWYWTEGDVTGMKDERIVVLMRRAEIEARMGGAK